MAGKDLDALAKELADERISRGQALRRIVGVLLGGVLAATPAAAFAQTGQDQTFCFDTVTGLVCCDPEGQPFPTIGPKCGFTSRKECERARSRASDVYSKCYPSSRL